MTSHEAIVHGCGADLLCDVACMTMIAPSQSVSVIDVVRDELTALVPQGHELDRTGGLTIERLSQHPLVCLPPGTGIRSALDRTFALHGLDPYISCEVSSGDAVIVLAARQFGVGILSRSMIGHTPTGIRVRPLRGRTVAAALAAIRHSSSSKPSDTARAVSMRQGIQPR